MILDHPTQLTQFRGRTVFLYPVYGDPTVHHREVSLLAVVLVDVNTKESFSLSFAHPDGLYHHPLDLNFLNNSVVYAYDKDTLWHKRLDKPELIDVQAQYYLYSNQACNFETPPIVSYYDRLYPACGSIGSLVSLIKHEEIARELCQDTLVRDIQPGLSFYQTTLLPALRQIESAGLQVDRELFKQRFDLDCRQGVTYTQYNPYTTTGRPSNRFAGVNYAALNKEDGSRDCFISRFGNQGRLVEIDFNAYHPRLIGSLVGYQFGVDSAYRQLAINYYGSNPSADQIAEMKEATFRQVYGGVQQQYLSIPFFYAADQLSRHLWEQFDRSGYIESPISGRHLRKSSYTDIDRTLLFNYFIQMYETEANMLILSKLLPLIQPMQTEAVLYTYDSILFDVPRQELPELVGKILPQCIDLQTFPIKVKTGENYGSMEVYNPSTLFIANT